LAEEEDVSSCDIFFLIIGLLDVLVRSTLVVWYTNLEKWRVDSTEREQKKTKGEK